MNTPLLLLIINQHLQDKRGDSTKGREKGTPQHLRWTWCHCLQETRSLQHIPYLDDVVYSSDHLTAEHERFEQLRLTSQLSLNDDPHLWDKPATHNLQQPPTHNQLHMHSPATSVVMASTSGVGSLARVKPPGIAMALYCTVLSAKRSSHAPSPRGM